MNASASPRVNASGVWWRTVGVVVGLELRQRTRSTRWWILLGLFFLAASAVVFGSMWFALAMSPRDRAWAYSGWADNLYFIVLGFTGFLGLVIAPTMTATSINGDRKDATLAVLQATPASGLQLATGKLLGAWVASCALIVIAAPYVIWATIEAEYPPLNSLLGVSVLAILFLTYCGIGLGLSALFSRPIGSAAVTQLVMLFLLIGIPVIFAMLIPATQERLIVKGPEYTATDDHNVSCRIVDRETSVQHPEHIWWVLSPNPVVMLADAAAKTDRGRTTAAERYDYGRRNSESALGVLAAEISEQRAAPIVEDTKCPAAHTSPNISFSGDVIFDTDNGDERYLGHTWYWGLLLNLVFGGIGLAFAARRLRVPAGRLPRGVRIA